MGALLVRTSLGVGDPEEVETGVGEVGERDVGLVCKKHKNKKVRYHKRDKQVPCSFSKYVLPALSVYPAPGGSWWKIWITSEAQGKEEEGTLGES